MVRGVIDLIFNNTYILTGKFFKNLLINIRRVINITVSLFYGCLLYTSYPSIMVLDGTPKSQDFHPVENSDYVFILTQHMRMCIRDRYDICLTVSAWCIIGLLGVLFIRSLGFREFHQEKIIPWLVGIAMIFFLIALMFN